jgi:GNAT superfamily N-acetyltransferase
VERRRASDAEELFRLYQEVFGSALTEGSRSRWRWQYLENPATTADGPEIWVAREGKRVLGQYASLPVRLQWGGHEVRSSWGMDVFLRGEARGKGIGAQLFTAWSDHVEVALGLGLTPSSYGLFKKLRYHDVGPVPFFQKVLDPVAVARRRVGRALAWPLGKALGVALELLQPEPGASACGVEVRRVTSFSADCDTLWERSKGAYAMCVRRDQAYLNWKYAACPTRRYELREARKDSLLTGIAVSRHEDYKGLRLGWLIDVFADPDDRETRRALIEDVLAGFRESGVARAQAFSMNAALAAELGRFGFRPGRSPMQFCVRTRVPSDEVLKDLGRWHVCFGDSDMDR